MTGKKPHTYADSFLYSRAEVYYNTRTKSYINSAGEVVPYEIMSCSRQIFSDGGNELSELSRKFDERQAYVEAAEELYLGKPCGVGYQGQKLTKQERLDASRRRARRRIFDLCICNDFDLFVTLTLSRDQIDRNDYGAVIKKINAYLGNRVTRRGLRYVGVPEFHQRGGIHFHFVANSEAFRLVDSGTVSVPDRKKPIKAATADRLGIPVELRRTVYNVSDWSLGFSTAIYTYGDRGALAHYMSKELCKDVQKKQTQNGAIEKIGGRWFFHGGKLRDPVCSYDNRNFRELTRPTYELSTDGGDFKCWRLTSEGEIL